MRKADLAFVPFFSVFKRLNRLQEQTAKDGGKFIPQNYIHCWITRSRFLLLLLTSILYLMHPPFSMLMIKLGVIAAITIEAFLARSLYLHNTSDRKFIIVLAVNETLGIIFLILLTGGLDSPFMWYALNPIIAAAVFLPIIYSWCGMILFISIAIATSVIYPGINQPFLLYIQNHLGIILTFFFVTLLYQLYASFFSRLSHAYLQLSQVHTLTEQSLFYISSFEQALEAFSSQQDRTQLGAVLSNYAAILCGCPAVCMLDGEDTNRFNKKGVCIKCSMNQSGILDQIWEEEMTKLWHTDLCRAGIWTGRLEGMEGEVVSVPIQSCGEVFGLLICVAVRDKNKDHVAKWLQLMAELGGITLDRLKSDELWGRLLVSEEQNRIANEIHDGVAQYLFSIVCALHQLSQEKAGLQDEPIQEQLHLIQTTAQRASRELRASIYGISSYKRGESVFVDSLASYLDKLGRLNGVRVDLFTEGNEDSLDSFRCKSLNRIIREASSNAIRHGRCHSLAVRLWMSPATTVLEIEDDGCGYQEASVIKLHQKQGQGLGIRNIQQIVDCFEGQVEIKSEAKACTVIRCTIPGKHMQREEYLKGGKGLEVSNH